MQNEKDARQLQVGTDTASVSFESVNFEYTPGREILSNLSFTVNPGQKIAIVGSSGSGYDVLSMLVHIVMITFVNLLPYYRPDHRERGNKLCFCPSVRLCGRPSYDTIR